MQSGMYVVFEGNDGAGKSSTMKAVAESLQKRLGKLPPLHLTHHPGATPLGAHIRKLVKYPELIDPDIEIDSLSRQMLYMVDTVNFIKQRLKPALDQHEMVFADRSSFVSALVYGIAEGLNLADIDRLFQLIATPKADRLYILQCDWQVGKERLLQRNDKLDHFERKPDSFFKKVEDTYNTLLTGSAERTLLVTKIANLDNVAYVDSTLPFAKVVDIIVNDLISEIEAKGLTCR